MSEWDPDVLVRGTQGSKEPVWIDLLYPWSGRRFGTKVSAKNAMELAIRLIEAAKPKEPEG